MSTHLNHPFHLVEKSPWPLTSSISAILLTSGLVIWFKTNRLLLIILRALSLTLRRYQWWRDVSRESSYQGLHTIKVVIGLQIGIILFITSEVIFFFSFFWAFFHRSLAPNLELGSCWPPTSIIAFNPIQIPFLNTVVLLSSGVSVTWAHHAVLKNNHTEAIWGLLTTILLGLYFTFLQAIEYIEASFALSDSVYGSTFYVATGFHGLHVIIGTIFILMGFIRLNKGLFSSNHHIGLEASIWYWHFVDVVWLFLYLIIYWWGS